MNMYVIWILIGWTSGWCLPELFVIAGGRPSRPAPLVLNLVLAIVGTLIAIAMNN